MRRYLVIANQTLDNPALHCWVTEMIATNLEGTHCHVVVPATRVDHRFTWTEGEALAAARRRLSRVLADFAALGASADGEVGDENPILAVADAVRQEQYDGIVVSTLPVGVSRWLTIDAVGQIRREIDIPVTHIETPWPVTRSGSTGSTFGVQADRDRARRRRRTAAVLVVSLLVLVAGVAGGPTHTRRAVASDAAPASATVATGGQAPAGHTTERDALAETTEHQGTTSATALEQDAAAPPPPYVDPTAPALMSGTVHDLDISAEEKDMTVMPGIVQHVWTLGGTVPAPTLRVRVGDTVRVHFRNPATNKMAHSLDFHASENAANDEMRTIAPGQEITTEWKANYAGVWMYHCVTGASAFHVGSGMFGMVIVEPKEGLPKVDKEFVVIQNEWYFGEQHGLTSPDKVLASAPAPDSMAFNGIPNQYVDKPFRMNPGERGRIFVLNVGPNLESSFHIVGMIFDTVIKEGVALLPNNQGHYGSQAVDLAPAQGAMVEFVAPENGEYEFVTHTFNFHDRGAHGMIQVGDGKPAYLTATPTAP